MRSSYQLSAIGYQPSVIGRPSSFVLRLSSFVYRPSVVRRRSSVLKRLADEAERAGWRQAALGVLGDEPGLLRYVEDERSSDWRFLLPELPTGEALCVSGALSPVPLALARTCRSVAVRCQPAEGRFLLARARQEGINNLSVLDEGADKCGPYDLVAALRTPFDAERSELTRYSAFLTHFAGTRHSAFPGQLPTLSRQVKPGGVLYLEVDGPALLNPPARLRARLRRLGFRGVRFYWPRPTFDRCEALFPLGDVRLQKYYLDHQFFAMSPARKALRLLLKVASNAGLFELTLPGYMVIARQAERERP